MQLLKPGTTFGGRYEIVRTLSAGGMGMVYEILHRDTKRRRAIKVMLPQMLANEEMRERFKREGLVTAGIESEHLVEVFDVGVDEETQAPFMVMELLRGEDLGARLARKERTRPAELLEIMEQVVRGLERTHAAGIIHRDLKPENLFVTHRDDGSKRVKILDFGIAKLVDHKSKATATIGTPLYMAPEQMTGESGQICPATDLYSLAHIVFTLLVGKPYFHAESETAASALVFMFRVSSGSVEPATKRGDDHGTILPDAFDAWFRRASQLDPKQRFQSATAFLSALRDVLKDSPDELPSSSAKLRVMAFQPTQPVDMEAISAATPELVLEPQTAASAGKTRLSRAGVDSHTGPIPSSHTVGLASKSGRPKNRVGLWIGAVALGAGVAAAIALAKGSDEPAATQPRADSAAEATRSVAAPNAPEITLAETNLAPPVTPSTPPAASSMIEPNPSVASANPTTSISPVASSAPPTSTKPRVTGVKPSATAQSSTQSSTPIPPKASTVWQGPRR